MKEDGTRKTYVSCSRCQRIVTAACCLQVLDEARRVVDVLDDRKAERGHALVAPRRRRLGDLYELAHKLSCVAHSWAQDPESVDAAKHLKSLRSDARAVLRGDRDVDGGAGEAQ